MDKFPKVTLKIKPDKTFEFVKIIRNPYIQPFDHPDEYFFTTSGTWTGIQDKKIEISSTKDSSTYPLVEIKREIARDDTISHFAFYDLHGDTVKILYVQYPDSLAVMVLHQSMESFDHDFRERDSLEFHFYGYKAWTYINGSKQNADFSVTLKPYFQPGYFKDAQFAVSKNRLVHMKSKIVFRKVNGQ